MKTPEEKGAVLRNAELKKKITDREEEKRRILEQAKIDRMEYAKNY